MALTQRSQDAVLLALQAPTGIPRSSTLATTTDPANPPRRSADLLSHFYEAIYDLSPESHLSRFLKVLLGDAGIGSLRKRYIVARMQSVLLTSRYQDLDKFYGNLFGFQRLAREVLTTSPYFMATPDEWDIIDSRDSSYRARVEQFSRSLHLGATPMGMAGVSSALLGGAEVRVYETYSFVDQNEETPGYDPLATGNTYGDIEADYSSYEVLQAGTYADIEGGSGGYGRTTSDNRSEFIVRPKRAITLEETYELVKVLQRLKPAQALLTIDARGVGIHRPTLLRNVSADSVYWEVEAKVAPRKDVVGAYDRAETDTVAAAMPRAAFNGYQGEAWSYNADIAAFSSYTEDADGRVLTRYDYERVDLMDRTIDYPPNKGLADQTALLLGRYASDGVLAINAAERLGT